MHTMQEDETQSMAQEESQGNGYLDAGSSRQARRPKEGKSARLVLAAVGGMLLPLLTQIGHAH
jgi:zinc transporter 9